MKAELDTVRFALKHVVSRVIVLVRVNQRYAVRATHRNIRHGTIFTKRRPPLMVDSIDKFVCHTRPEQKINKKTKTK